MSEKIYIKIEGMNLSRLIDRLVEKGICLTNLKIKGHTLTCCLEKKDFNVFESVCDAERKTYQIISKYGIKNIFISLKKSLGFVLAVIISFSYLYAYNGLILNLNLSYSSVSDYDMSTVERVLETNGVKQGAILNLSTNEIEQILLKNIKDISGCTVVKSGSNLSICVYPEIDNGLVEKEIVAKYGAVITKLEVFSGTTKYNVGDIVKQGDVLIEDGVQAKGVVKGKVYFSAYEIYNENQQKVTYTGNYFSNRTVSLFGNILYKQAKINTFSQYLTKKCVFSITENLFLPLICNEEFVFEVKIENEFVPFETKEVEIKQKLIDELGSKNNIEINDDAITFSVVRDGELVRVDCFAEIEMNIA